MPNTISREVLDWPFSSERVLILTIAACGMKRPLAELPRHSMGQLCSRSAGLDGAGRDAESGLYDAAGRGAGRLSLSPTRGSD